MRRDEQQAASEARRTTGSPGDVTNNRQIRKCDEQTGSPGGVTTRRSETETRVRSRLFFIVLLADPALKNGRRVVHDDR